MKIDEEKRAAGFAAVDRYVRDGMTIGLGTGTTAYWAIERVGQRVREDGWKIVAVPTSVETAEHCGGIGIPLRDAPDDLGQLDVDIDGADEIGPGLALIKGGGGALFREKVVAVASRAFVVVAGAAKVVPALGGFPLPVEVVPFALAFVQRQIEKGDGTVERRVRDGQPFVTDNGNAILDVRFARPIDDPERLRAHLESIVGVVTSGLFVGLATCAVVADADGTVRVIER